MKKILSLALVLILCLSQIAFADAGTDLLIAPAPKAEIPIKIIADNKIVDTDTVVIEERTLIPLRALLESTGAQVEWDNPTQTAFVTRNEKTISVSIGSNIMKTPTGDVTLEVSPILHNGTTTYAPLRAIAEEFGIKVDWDNGTKTILVTTPDGCPYVDFYDGATLEDFVNDGQITVEDFETVYNLSYKENKNKLYSEIVNMLPFTAMAELNGLKPNDLKLMLTLSDDYPTDITWGEALGDVPFGTYLYIVEGVAGEEGMTIDQTVDAILASFGLGEEYSASTPYKFVRTILDTRILEEQQKQAEEIKNQMEKDLEELPSLLKNKLYFTITLQDGSVMKGELYPDLAPETVANFVELVKSKFYDGLIFHRVIDGFMIQAGAYDKNFTPKLPEKAVKGEFYANGVKNALKHEKGVISMARTNDPNSATSQFFIMDEATPSLDGNYAAFGKITKGLDVIERISKVKTHTNEEGFADVPVTPVVIKTIRMSKQ